MTRPIYLLILALSIAKAGNSQLKDTLLFKVLAAEQRLGGSTSFKVIFFNTSDTPVCILHAVGLNLIEGTEQPLGLWSDIDTVAHYRLWYAAADTLIDYEGKPSGRNGTVILPRQGITLDLLLPSSGGRAKDLEFEFISLPNFCYQDFVADIFRHSAAWYEQYRIRKRTVLMPDVNGGH